MKWVLLVFLLIICSLFKGFGQVYNPSDKRMYTDSSLSTPYSGALNRYTENGLPWEKENYVNGFKDGICTYYYERNKQVQSTITYSQGKRHGEHISYYENGRIDYKNYWENGKRRECTSYDKQGNLLSKTVWRNDSVISDYRPGR